MRKLVLLFLLWPAFAFAQGERSPDELRQICVEAMNKNETFAQDIVRVVNAKTAQAHLDAANDIAKNERHVILAYGAMWVVAAGFVIFLWRRQQLLRGEIARLRKDLDAASAESGEK